MYADSLGGDIGLPHYPTTQEVELRCGCKLANPGFGIKKFIKKHKTLLLNVAFVSVMTVTGADGILVTYELYRAYKAGRLVETGVAIGQKMLLAAMKKKGLTKYVVLSVSCSGHSRGQICHA